MPFLVQLLVVQTAEKSIDGNGHAALLGHLPHRGAFRCFARLNRPFDKLIASQRVPKAGSGFDLQPREGEPGKLFDS